MEKENPLAEMILAGLTILSEKADKPVSELTVLELEKVMRFLAWEQYQNIAPKEEKYLFNKAEAAHILRISRRQLDYLITQKKVQYRKIGSKKILFTMEDIIKSTVQIEKK